MLAVAGYTFTATFAQTGFSSLYRGLRAADGLPVVAKVIRSERPTRSELARLKHEVAVLQSLAGKASVVELVEVRKTANGPVLVLEDLGERSVGSHLGRALELREFLELAMAMTRALRTVHERRIIHKDLKPGHFMIVDGEVGGPVQTKIVDFGLSAQLPEETRAIQPEQLEGTLAYMSPEQTGRVNRLVDFRSDQYSLGVCFYELLTGRLPFQVTDPLELVHSHIARAPRPPTDLRPDLPRALSDVVMKLLAKTAEDRYRSDSGLEFDLASCLEHFREKGHVPELPLGTRDFSTDPQIPQKLYGREAETERLLDAFSRVRGGAAELLLITGGSGVGKSALVKQLQKHLVLQGQFVSGKFDQLARNVPYTGIAQACRELVCSVLTRPAEEIDAFRSKVLRAVGQNAQLVAALVPELGTMLGPQPAPPALGPTEAQHRFERVFQTFLQLFTTREHPLVLFLDDLQWADPASLALVQGALTARGAGHVLIIGAYRDAEVSPVHPLSLAIDDARRAGAVVAEVRLQTLAIEHVGQYLADALCCDVEPLRPLAERMRRKTDGNPFFLGVLLTTLHEDGLLRLDPATGTWTWDVDRLEDAYLTDNVVDFLVDRLRRLAPETQAVLMLAACVGHTFDRDTLSSISEDPRAGLARALWEARREGVIRRLASPSADEEWEEEGEGLDGSAERTTTYRFVHDRVQQAAYALVDDRRRQELHLRIGQLLLARHRQDPPDELLFEVVTHLNLGVGLIPAGDREARRTLARLNLRAANQARDAAAYRPAIEALTVCEQLLGDGAWSTDYEMARAAHLTKAQCQAQCGDFDEAFRLLDIAEQRSRTPVERAPAQSLRTGMLTALNRLPDAIAAAAAAAAAFGVELPDDPARLGPATSAAFDAVKAALAGRAIESLVDLPPMRDPRMLALLDVLYKAVPAAYQANARLMVLIVLRATEIALRHGNAPVTPFFYCNYGIVHAESTGDAETGYRFGQLGIELCRRTRNVAVEGATRFLFAAALSHWRSHIQESVECFRQGLKASLEGGDHIHAGYCAAHGLYTRLFAGEPMSELASELAEFVAFCRSTGDRTNVESLQILGHAIAAARGELDGSEGVPDARFGDSLRSSHKAAMLLLEAIRLYGAGEFDRAIEAADAAPPFSPRFFMGVEWRLFRALAVAGKLRATPPDGRAPLVAALRDAERTFAAWAAGCPENHAVRHALLAAELAVAEDRPDAAIDAYDRAIDLAQEHGFLQLQALANELCAKFLLHRNRRRFAGAHLQDAIYCYERWGARIKAEALAAQYRDLLSGGAGAVERDRSRQASVAQTLGRVAESARSAVTAPGGLDLLTVIRATRVIASELDLGRLLERLMRILLENAGAQRGVLVLGRDNSLEVVAEATLSPDQVDATLHEPLDKSERLAASVANYVAHSGEAVVLDDAQASGRFARDPYVQRVRPHSILSLALQHQGRVTGVLYFENDAGAAAFSPSRVELLQFLAVQAAIAITNARLYDNLEDEVAQRTAALKLVLDSTGDGLLTVDIDGRVDPLRSYAAATWFGEPCSPPETVWSLLHGGDAAKAMTVQVGFEQLVEGVLPFEVTAAQMPKRIVNGERTLELEWRPVRKAGRLDRVLLVARDVSQLVLAERAERDARETTELVSQVLKSKAGFGEAVREARALVDAIARGGDLDSTRRALHTLKGNAAMFGLRRLSERCHEVEDQVERKGCAPSPETAAALCHELDSSLQRLHDLFGANVLELVEVRDRDLERLLRGLEEREDPTILQSFVSSWRHESVDAILHRYARQARRIADDLGKEVDISVDERGARVLSSELRSFWGAFVHVIRNAIDHGVEDPRERRAAGKRERARVTLRGELESASLVLTVEDDGRGIDFEALRESALRRGLPAGNRDQLIAALFVDGVSTKAEVTSLSGRGIGMAALRRACEELGGTVEVNSQLMAGTRFAFRLPVGRRAIGSSSGERRDSLAPMAGS